jgi:hypothetical protein
MIGRIVRYDPLAGRGVTMLYHRPSGHRQFFPFSVAAVRGGEPRVGPRAECAIAWPSWGPPYAADLRILDAPRRDGKELRCLVSRSSCDS